MGITADNLPHLSRKDGDLDEDEILNIIGQELQQASGGNENDFIDQNRQDSLSYYLGSQNGLEVEGKSTVISTDVADAIEWIIPTIMKQFTANNEVVRFDPVFEGDENQADLESQFTYDVLMKENDGFVILHTLVKDCLMQKNGIIKTYYEELEVEEVQEYTGIGPNAYQVLLSEEGVEIIEETIHEPMEGDNEPNYDCKVKVVTIDKHIVVVSVPPEEFRIARQHNSISLKDVRFCAHVLLVSRSDLIKQGYDEDLVYSLPTGEIHNDDRNYRFYMQNETVYPDRDISNDDSQSLVEISECYINIDMENTGVAERYKIVVSGGDNPDHILGYERVDEHPFDAGTAIMMSHKFFGLSIYDRLCQIQDQKTTLWRNIFDNLYLQNNQRNVVVEGQVNLDDLLVSRPGGIIRAKSLGAIEPLQTPMLGQEAYQMMDYLDQVRAGRAGVSPEGSVQVDNIGDRIGSEGIMRLMTAKEELVGLMIRVIAETCIKPLMYRIRDLSIRHMNTLHHYKFRGTWSDTVPSSWVKRKNSTVRVGTGTGNNQEMIGALQQILDWQERLSGDPEQAVLGQQQIFNALNDFGKAAGLLGVRNYFIDPASPEGQQKQQEIDQQAAEQSEIEQQMQAQQADFQTKLAKAESDKGKAQLATAAANAETSAAELKLQHLEQMNKIQMETLKMKLEHYKLLASQNKDDKELQFKYDNLAQMTALELTRIESQEDIAEQNNNFQENKEAVNG